ncbi:hypothetical protein SAZ10_17690 [Mesorhizobium sp. BAC0120]|uniref:hypothetical protein n=1 Tax=Mesorhizobium sp. BAC0120 TaxID=3090670 RepID=UPI00298CC76B|nr:hypothetical protein [Mesorhizobium sp. BAC0120]MDW6023586.1 hypothetical protein [Mesorhizobium sp. BAC0120]
MKNPAEATSQRNRRAEGRSEDRNILDEQLDEGLQGTFPGSDPVSVTTSLISGCPKVKKPSK